MAKVKSISGKRWQLIHFENHRTNKLILLFRHIINCIHIGIDLRRKIPIEAGMDCQLHILFIGIFVKNLVDVNRLIKWRSKSICVPGRMLKCTKKFVSSQKINNGCHVFILIIINLLGKDGFKINFKLQLKYIRLICSQHIIIDI